MLPRPSYYEVSDQANQPNSPPSKTAFPAIRNCRANKMVFEAFVRWKMATSLFGLLPKSDWIHRGKSRFDMNYPPLKNCDPLPKLVRFLRDFSSTKTNLDVLVSFFFWYIICSAPHCTTTTINCRWFAQVVCMKWPGSQELSCIFQQHPDVKHFFWKNRRVFLGWKKSMVVCSMTW